MKFILTLFISVFLLSSTAVCECKKHIELLPASKLAMQYGKTEMWVLRNHKVKLWANPSPKKFPKIGELLPGSRAIILEEKANDYKVLSPLDGSEGWISKIQVNRTLMQDSKTNQPCG